MMKRPKVLALPFWLPWMCTMHAQRSLTVQANKPGAEIQSTMYGIFFEDINFGADGGLYADM